MRKKINSLLAIIIGIFMLFSCNSAHPHDLEYCTRNFYGTDCQMWMKDRQEIVTTITIEKNKFTNFYIIENESYEPLNNKDLIIKNLL